MSENLIYGADITAYGAVADGKTDCSDAFIKAIENGESLIVVPYGRYSIKKTIKLNSNTKIHLHPNALILFDHESDENAPLFYAEGASSIEIHGGKLIVFDNHNKMVQKLIHFKNSNNIKIKKCYLSMFESTAVVFDSCENVCVSECKIGNTCTNAFELLGNCSDITFKSSKVQAAFFLSIGNEQENCNLSSLSIRDIKLDVSHCIASFDSKICGVKCENITGTIGWSFLTIDKKSKFEDAEFENIDIYSTSSFTGNTKQSCFYFEGSVDGLEITGFKRNTECEAIPFIPTLVFKASDDSKAIIDGMLLDNVINARALSKTIRMTTARLTNPTGKFIYTLECGIKKNDTLTIPLGDFDSLTVYTK